jgi:hypothetical protein
MHACFVDELTQEMPRSLRMLLPLYETGNAGMDAPPDERRHHRR